MFSVPLQMLLIALAGWMNERNRAKIDFLEEQARRCQWRPWRSQSAPWNAPRTAARTECAPSRVVLYSRSSRAPVVLQSGRPGWRYRQAGLPAVF